MVGWVPQRPHLFTATVGENIRLGRPEASEAEVERACRAAALDPVIDRLPDGLATRLGEGGAGLSVGERQRVALARAFLRDGPVLLLDEPTAGLDGPTEQAVLGTVRKLSANRTVVMVAHRPALLRFADRVVRLPAPARVGPP
jgi:ATP-binding cassette subfamily C protein CydCD